MNRDLTKLSYNEISCVKKVIAFIKDGVLYKNRWILNDDISGLVERVGDIVYINSADKRYMKEVREFYKNEYIKEFKIGTANTDSLTIAKIIELANMENMKRTIGMMTITEPAIMSLEIGKYKDFNGHVMLVNISTNSTMKRLENMILELKETECKLSKVK